MYNESLIRQENKVGTQKIKVEVFETEDYLLIQKHEQVEADIYQDIKIEDTVLDLGALKYEYNNDDEISTIESNAQYHVDVHLQDDWKEEHLEYSATSSQQQDEEKLYEYKQPHSEITGWSDEFKSQDCLNIHIQVHCDDEPKNLNKTAFNNHMRLHSNEKPFKCKQSECNKSFKSKYDLNVHMRVHSGEKPFECKQNGCTKSFKTNHELKAHTRVHSDEKPFKCTHDGCTRSFRTKYETTVHMRVHSDEKLYHCQQIGCIKSFKCKGELASHMRVHSDKTPFVCGEISCAKSFKTQGRLNRHMKVHKAEPISKFEKEDSTVK